MRVWNITHLTGEPRVIYVSKKRCAPRKSVEVEALTKKEENLVGTYLYVGQFIPPVKGAKKDPLTQEECVEILNEKTKEQLVNLASNISPALSSSINSKSKSWLVSKISKAIFSEQYSVDPQMFYWTNLWNRVGPGYRRK